MMDLLLIRHGETAWNRVRRMQGHIDIPLNEVGQRQAQALGDALSVVPVQAVYASDLQRARDTAQAVANSHALTVSLHTSLRERCYGAFEGLLYADISERYPEAFAQWRAREPGARFPAGEREAETLQEFHQRSVEAVTHIMRSHEASDAVADSTHTQHGVVVIVTHGGVLDCLYREARGMTLEAERNFGIVNAAINHLQWDGQRFHVLTWADATHLEAAGLDEIDRSHPAA